MAFTATQTPRERKLGEATQAASAYFGETITSKFVLDKSKRKNVARARMWCMAYIRWRFPEMSQPQTARLFQKKDHTTVWNAERRARVLFPDAIFCLGDADEVIGRIEALGLGGADAA